MRPSAAAHGVCVVREVRCIHQVEVEIWPSNAEVYFRNERYVDPVSTQVRFSAAVYNAAKDQVYWAVLNLDGGPGRGQIDASGLYTAPVHAPGVHGTTDVIVASAADDPTRRAYAHVTLVGAGPVAVAAPTIELFPRQAQLYYPAKNETDDPNRFIDVSNTRQLFRARVRDVNEGALTWQINGVPGTFTTTLLDADRVCELVVSAAGAVPEQRIDISVRISAAPQVIARASARVSHYSWPSHRPADVSW